jgi:tetratricopeptide (TPR) repeat protein
VLGGLVMDYQHIQTSIAYLQQAIERLQELTPTSHDLTGLAVADEVQEQLKKALAALSTAINPQIPDKLSGSLLQQIEDYGIPLDDLEVRAALVAHHPSQIVGVLNEIADRYADIRRRREYFLVRLPEQPVEELGSRLPFYQASDFTWAPPPTPPEKLAALRQKYQLDRLQKKRSADIFGKLEEAHQAWEQAQKERPAPE